MINNFFEVQKHLINGGIILDNQNMQNIIKGYNFINVVNDMNIESHQEIYLNLKSSREMILSSFKEINQNNHFIGFFEKTVFLIEKTKLPILQSFFSYNNDLKICFLSNYTKNSFDQNFKGNYKELNKNKFFEECIDELEKRLHNLKKINELEEKIWKEIKQCISTYLIIKSCDNASKNRIKEFFSTNQSNDTEIDCINEDDFIKLKVLEPGSSFMANIEYNIRDEKLCVFLILKESNSQIADKSLSRELRAYLSLNHPFLPKFYGITNINNYIVIEYIYGDTLLGKCVLNDDDKITIIFELMLVIQYLQKNGFIYRDLKPNNIMIDSNKTLVLIDFDKMIEFDEESKTHDFASTFVANEVNEIDRLISSSCDIYSLGKIIEFIMKGIMPDNENDNPNNNKYSSILSICKRCINENPEKRPLISDLLFEMFYNYNNQLKIECLNKMYNFNEYILNSTCTLLGKCVQLFNNPVTLFNQGMYYFDGKYVKRDINKAIYFFNSAAKLNSLKAQFILASIYYDGTFVERNINKAIHFFDLAAKQNDKISQFYLGTFYYEGKYVQRDINKAIYFLTLSANQNFVQSQYNLGIIYANGEFIAKNLNKAIEFLTLAADQNFVLAQKSLGNIYFKGENGLKNITKAIEYYEKAANQNCVESQNILGEIYSDGEYVLKNIDKSIYYFSLAANQNNEDAQYNLGIIYYNDPDKFDINKAIHYFSLAAKQYHVKSLYSLGVIYSDGLHVKKDLKKAIYFYLRASDQYHEDSQYNLGLIYSDKNNDVYNINAAIHYLTLAANQNHLYSLVLLGDLYYNGEKIKKDINKAIGYYQLAAQLGYIEANNILGTIYYSEGTVPLDEELALKYFFISEKQNDPYAQLFIGMIYYNGEKIKKNINKSIKYLTKAANQDNQEAQYYLGLIFFSGDDVTQDINKAIYYLNLAANKNHPKASFFLGSILYKGKHVSQDINKAINYFKISALQNNSQSQLILGAIYIDGKFVPKNIKLGINYIESSFKNGDYMAAFYLGCYYHRGKYVVQDIQKSIRMYKEATLKYNNYAKNNLGIIYKHGFQNEIKKNIDWAIIYFNEAINQNNDIIAMYNLAHIYFYEETIQKDLDKSIELLIKSSEKGFRMSKTLLCIVLIKKFDFNLEKINIFTKLHESTKSIYEMIIEEKFIKEPIFDEYYDLLKRIDFIYDFDFKYIKYDDFLTQNLPSKHDKNPAQNLSMDFYDGFNFDY